MKTAFLRSMARYNRAVKENDLPAARRALYRLIGACHRAHQNHNRVTCAALSPLAGACQPAASPIAARPEDSHEL